MDVKDILLSELFQDRAETIADIAICKRALAYGVVKHRDGYPVEDRLNVNGEILIAIDRELSRRAALGEPTK
jgi:hypothetical protein